jgi:hypothetical protein
VPGYVSVKGLNFTCHPDRVLRIRRNSYCVLGAYFRVSPPRTQAAVLTDKKWVVLQQREFGLPGEKPCDDFCSARRHNSGKNRKPITQSKSVYDMYCVVPTYPTIGAIM